MLLLTGATGKVGRPLAEMLGARGVPFRALVRSLDRAAPLRDAGAELVEGDLARPDTLARAFDGVDRLFLLTAPAEEMVALQHNAIEAARAAGVRHVVKLSAVGAGPGDPVPVRVARWHAEIEGALRASGMAWTMIRPHGFMQNTFAFAPSVAAEGRFYAPDTGRYPVVDARDVAAVAAAALTGGAHEGAEYEVTGPERLSRADIAAALADALGRPVTWVPVSYDAARAAMMSSGLPEWLADDLATFDRLFAEGLGCEPTDVVRRVGGVEPRTYARFAREAAPAFQPSPVMREGSPTGR